MADGVERGGSSSGADQNATEGNIFKDMVFWVALRVPMRNHILELIRKNGGLVAPLEKDAQVLIADPARKDAPPDSISCKYITDSVANGCAQLTDRYCILGPSSSGTRGRTKQTRSEFTSAEDAALANWVLAHSKDRTGNEIYKEFAETHPSHPWQSWRNRFVKVLSNRPMQALKRLAMSAADLAVQPVPRPERESGQTSPTAPSKTQAGTGGKEPSRASPASQQTRPAAVQRPSSGKNSTVSPRAPASVARAMSPAGSAKQARRQSSLPPIFSPARSEEAGVETQVNMRDRFYHDLFVFVEESGMSVNPDPEVRGKRIELWDLSQAIASQKLPPEEVDWLKVAEDLRYDWRQDRGVIDELRRCFEENLAGFFEAISSFTTEEEAGVEEAEEGEEEAEVEEAEEGEEEAEAEEEGHEEIDFPSGQRSPRSVIPSSPLAGPWARKRSLDDDSPFMAENPAKRRRLNRTAREDDASSEDSLPDMHINAKPRLETRRSSFDPSPSQQLRSEALDVDTIPLNLGRSRSAGRQQQAGTPEPGAKAKKTNGFVRRTLPVWHKPNPEHFPPQQAERRTKKLSTAIRAEPDESSQSRSIGECVEYYESLGYSRPVVVESLSRASMRPGWPASYLMELLSEKQNIPSNIEGVWTDRDDKGLRYADGVQARWATATAREQSKAMKELGRLVNKHTEEDEIPLLLEAGVVSFTAGNMTLMNAL